MNNDIEQRAEKDQLAKIHILDEDQPLVYYNLELREICGYALGYIAGATEERERGKRFAKWAVINGWGFSISREKYYLDKLLTPDQLFDLFLEKEKELNN